MRVDKESLVFGEKLVILKSKKGGIKMLALFQTIQAVVGGIGVGLCAFWNGLQMYLSFNSTITKIVAVALGISIVAAVVLRFLFSRLISLLRN